MYGFIYFIGVFSSEGIAQLVTHMRVCPPDLLSAFLQNRRSFSSVLSFAAHKWLHGFLAIVKRRVLYSKASLGGSSNESHGDRFVCVVSSDIC